VNVVLAARKIFKINELTNDISEAINTFILLEMPNSLAQI
jgi:hypothetical protein